MDFCSFYALVPGVLDDVKLVPVEGVEAFEVSPGDYPHLICFIPASNVRFITLC